MIDLYKQNERQRSGLRYYFPAYAAFILAGLILLLSNNSIGAAFSGEGREADNLPAVIPGEGLDGPIRISDDIRFDSTIPPLHKSFWQELPHEQVIENLIGTMSDEELISQIFLAGWKSEHAEGPIMDWISRRNIGGVKIFGWNGKNLQNLSVALSQMQAAALSGPQGIPLFTATDQEGGWVRHIKDGTSITPGNMAIGASALPLDSYLSGYYIGRELRAIGVNMNFAPTVDVYVNKDAHVIGPRAFSADPQNTAILGSAFFHGMRQMGIIATAKHFPGHGNALGDSHIYLPVVEDDLEMVWERDMLPYRMMIPEGLPAILSAHLSFPRITGDNRPASLSPYFKNELLREKLGFEGIVITDDLYMGAAQWYGDNQGWDMARIVLEALRAGNDMVMLSETPALNDSIWERVYAEYQENEVFRTRIREAVARILKIKLLYLRENWRVPLSIDPAQVYNDIAAEDGQPFFQEQAARGVTLIRDHAIPFRNSAAGKVFLVSQDRDFLREGSRRYPGAGQFYFDYSPFYWADEDVIANIQRRLPNYDKVIFNLTNPNSLEVLKSLEEHEEKIIVFSTLTPVYLEEVPWVRSAIAVYGWGIESFSAGFAALHGDIPFKGRLPVSISPDNPASAWPRGINPASANSGNANSGNANAEE